MSRPPLFSWLPKVALQPMMLGGSSTNDASCFMTSFVLLPTQGGSAANDGCGVGRARGSFAKRLRDAASAMAATENLAPHELAGSSAIQVSVRARNGQLASSNTPTSLPAAAQSRQGITRRPAAQYPGSSAFQISASMWSKSSGQNGGVDDVLAHMRMSCCRLTTASWNGGLGLNASAPQGRRQ
eukprot:1158333-Pelagomonas_calceolata.AAC.3